MPIRVRKNSKLGLIVVVFEGVVTEKEIELELAPLVDDPRYSLMPLALFDTTSATRAEAPSEVLRDGARRAERWLGLPDDYANELTNIEEVRPE